MRVDCDHHKRLPYQSSAHKVDNDLCRKRLMSAVAWFARGMLFCLKSHAGLWHDTF